MNSPVFSVSAPMSRRNWPLFRGTKRKHNYTRQTIGLLGMQGRTSSFSLAVYDPLGRVPPLLATQTRLSQQLTLPRLEPSCLLSAPFSPPKSTLCLTAGATYLRACSASPSLVTFSRDKVYSPPIISVPRIQLSTWSKKRIFWKVHTFRGFPPHQPDTKPSSPPWLPEDLSPTTSHLLLLLPGVLVFTREPRSSRTRSVTLQYPALRGRGSVARPQCYTSSNLQASLSER